MQKLAPTLDLANLDSMIFLSEDSDPQQNSKDVCEQHVEGDSQRRLKRKAKNRNQKKKRKDKQAEMEYDLAALFELILLTQNPFSEKRQQMEQIVIEFSAKPTQFFRILDEVLRVHLDTIVDEFWQYDYQTPEEEIPEERVGFTLIERSEQNKLIVFKFQQQLKRLQKSNSTIVSLLEVFFRVCPNKQRQKKYSEEGILMGEYIYLMQSNQQLMETVVERRMQDKKTEGLQDISREQKFINSFLCNRLYQAFEILQSEQTKGQSSKSKRRKKHKAKPMSESLQSQAVNYNQAQCQLEEAQYHLVLRKIQMMEPAELMLRIELTPQQLQGYRYG